MNYIKITILILPLLLIGCGSNHKERQYMGYKVFDKDYIVAGGETVVLPITNAGPIPAENNNYKIEVAGILTSPSKKQPNKSVITFRFSFINKKSNSLKSVIVEQVFPNKNSLILIEDYNPETQENIWSNGTDPVIINKVNLPWFYEEGTTTFVFKFTIETNNGEKLILYQPSSFFEQAKKALTNQHK